uniref:Reverse transcriptase zinc-binding domain-containing protein n=1 Tax=Arundo donax TaxID=35708 RepID=A0A0A9GPV4_ARUDO
MTIMRKFGEATGLRINVNKCNVATIRCQDMDLDDILQDFAGQRTTFAVTYLGLPITMGRLKLIHVQHIQDKAKEKMAGWQGKLLNPAGHRELVRTVLSSLPTYLLTALKSPKKFIEEFDKSRRCFLWAGNHELHGGKCKVNWLCVCHPIRHAGLSVHNLERFGCALRLKWLWYSWTKPSSAWIEMELPTNDTNLALFAMATRVQVQNGRTASFWFSSWLKGMSPALLFPNLYRHSRRKKRTVAEALNNDRWVTDIGHNLTTDLLVDYFCLWNLIDEANLNLDTEESNQITWTCSSLGEYTAKSAYETQFEDGVPSKFPELIWRIWAPPKCKFFAWLLQNRVWTADRLQQRGWPNNYFCALCQRNLETGHHMMVECPVVQQIWSSVAAWVNCNTLAPSHWIIQSSIQDWYASLAPRNAANGTRSLALLTIWSIWRERNNRIFKSNVRPVHLVVSEIQDEARQWYLAGTKAFAPLVDHQPSE